MTERKRTDLNQTLEDIGRSLMREFDEIPEICPEHQTKLDEDGECEWCRQEQGEEQKKQHEAHQAWWEAEDQDAEWIDEVCQ